MVPSYPPRRPGFASAQHVGFVVDKAALGQVFSSTSVSPANHSTNFSIIIITRGWHNRPISGRSAEWTQLDSTHHYTNLKRKRYLPKSNLCDSYYIALF
jgi:hypothetical protein